MAAALPNPNWTETQKPYQLFTHASVVAFTTMGMVRPITLTWEDIAYQPIFGNRNILNPNAVGGPCAWTKDMVCMQDAHHFKYVFQLIKGFNRTKYRNTPIVPPSPFIDIDDFATKYPSMQICPTQVHLDLLIDSLPAGWAAVLTQGNQTFADGELFATSLGGILQDVYLYKGGTLTKYLAQPTPGLYSASNHTSLPSTSIHTVSQGVPTIISFPPLKKLRRVHFQDLNNDMSMVRIFSFMLPPHPRSNPTTFFGGVLIGSYSHPSIQ